jgi:ABC-2 type transport system ATP-binding protein
MTSAGIELRGLTKSYGEIRAVRGIDATIARGETVALLGPNGAGKSTTLDILLGLLDADDGTASVFGLSPPDAVASGTVGAMLQTGGLIRDLRVRELVAMMSSLYPDPLGVDEVLKLTGTDDIAEQITQRLSGGQTQRVRFALALVANPELLVLDEPTVALDVEGRREFWTTMREFAARGKTIVFATHYLEEARRPDGTRAGRRRRADDRDQGARRDTDDPRDAPGHAARAARARPRRHARRTAR